MDNIQLAIKELKTQIVKNLFKLKKDEKIHIEKEEPNFKIDSNNKLRYRIQIRYNNRLSRYETVIEIFSRTALKFSSIILYDISLNIKREQHSNIEDKKLSERISSILYTIKWQLINYLK